MTRALKWWEKPIVGVMIVVCAPLVLGLVAWRAARWRVWAGKIFIVKGGARGSR